MSTGRTTPPPLPRAPTPAPVRRSLVGRAVLGLVCILGMAAGGAWLLHASIEPDGERDVPLASPSRHELLAGLKSWGYQLQGLDVASAGRSPFDLLVVDETLDGAKRPERRAEVLKSLKRKPDGTRRLVLAYLSIGEAEDYRRYWNKAWVGVPPPPALASPVAEAPSLAGTSAHARPLTGAPPSGKPLRQPTAAAPAWLGDENGDWRGNFRVRFWDESWQALMLGSEGAALDRLIAEGFDGVYLDRADVYQLWSKERPGAKSDMTSLVQRLSEHARARAPGFMIVMQNAEELLGSGRIRAALDAVAKEDLLFGIDGSDRANSEGDVAASLKLLKKAQQAGLPVLVVEYVKETRTVAAARAKLAGEGFVPYFAPRALDHLRAAE